MLTLQHRQSISRGELLQLAESQGSLHISLTMPAHRGGKETRQDPIRFRNLLKEAEEKLVERGIGEGNARRMLEPARNLLDDGDFWQHQSDGLAIYMHENDAWVYRLPHRFEERVLVSRHFHLKPLFAGFSRDQFFYIAVISKDEFHLLECTNQGFTKLDLGEFFPDWQDSVGRFLEREKQMQFHTSMTGGGGSGGGAVADHAAVWHGQGSIKDDEKIRVREYLQAMEEPLRRVIRDYRTPIVFAGVSYLLPMFRDAVSDSLNVADDHVAGNADEVRSNFPLIHEKAKEILGRRFEEATKQALELHGQADAKGHAASRIEDVVVAAFDGLVDQLLVDPTQAVWGTFDEEKRRVNVDEKASDTDTEDLVNLACIYTLRNGGRIHPLEAEKVPGRNPAVAIFRY